MIVPAFLRRSVRGKVTALVVATTLSALLVAGAALAIYTVHEYQEQRLNDVRSQAEILGRASAPALAFNDRKDAVQNLAMLKARPDVQRAALYAGDGGLFAAYPADAEGVRPPEGTQAGTYVMAGSVTVVQPVVEGGQRLGVVVVEARYDLRARLLAYGGILAAALLAAFGAALLMSAWLQRAVTGPILSLAGAARAVVERRDFSLRAPKTTEDEIGVLADAMNRMLAALEREIAERRAAEQALRATDRRKDEFLATLAHELRNPLAPILNGLALLRMPGMEPAAATEARAIIERQVRQMVRLVDDLIDVSRVTTGRLALRRERAELRAVASTALEAAAPLVQQRRHELRAELPEGGVMVNVDATRLSQVLLNLLNNAAKFTPPGGRIDFSVAVREREIIARVRDNGIGIAPQLIEPIFEMFAQADRSLERSTMGLGVGLTLSRRLVELHGGTLVARSEGEGRGAEFEVRIPALDLQRADPASAAGPGQRRGPRRVLVVDDNEDFAATLANMLRHLGHEVRVEHDGAAGLAAAESFQPEIAFLDIGMPKMNGYELAERLRRGPATGTTILIAVTGWGQEADRERARRAGFDKHIVKPIELDRLGEILGA